MTDAITRAQQAEAEARELVTMWFPENDGSAQDALDAYRLAVRQSVLTEAVAVVEGMRTYGPVETFDGTEMEADNLATWVNRYDVLAALRGLTDTEGRE